jgi:NAD(P)H-dependent flavin oxidoreductase YrpB (nitropropane dioxygenase family)
MLVRKANGRVDGFVVEAPIAGGHNAPPRGRLEIDAEGEPVYGERDVVDLEEMRRLGKPFWLAGGTGSPGAIRNACDAGAAGVQIGTLFAFTEESGLAPELKRAVLAKARIGDVAVTTDLRASPTGFPFKVVKLEGTNSEANEYAQRGRKCDLGYLRSAYQRPDGKIAFRCAAEPQSDWVNKGGTIEDTEGRKCLCNGLMANIGLAQIRADGIERAILTSGNDVASLQQFASDDDSGYTVDQVIDYLMSTPDHVPESRLSLSDICLA